MSRFQVDNGKSLNARFGQSKETAGLGEWIRDRSKTQIRGVQIQKFKIGEQVFHNPRGVLKHDHQPSSCFVATATFGDPSDDTVVSLRGYRDLVLSRSLLGKLFIQLYYRIGPYLARCVEEMA